MDGREDRHHNELIKLGRVEVDFFIHVYYTFSFKD